MRSSHGTQRTQGSGLPAAMHKASGAQGGMAAAAMAPTPSPHLSSSSSTTHTRRAAGHTPRPGSKPKPSTAFPDALLQAVRETARITDLFPQAALKRRGSEFLTLCPWHQDTNASLTISPRTNRVHCFVCNKGADPIGWLQDNQGLTFIEAVQELARRYGIPIPEQDPQAAAHAEALRKEQQRLLSWREKQQQAFHQALLEDLERNGSAAVYLRERGLSVETARAWGLGLNGSRLMLPLRDALGRTCAFSGRSLTREEPKYRNSANDALFRKQDLLFGLDRAAPAIRRSGEALLVEGPIDVLQLHQTGLDHAVASLGTAFSIEQAQRLIRSGAKRLWVALDGDKAGQAATSRLIEGLRPLAIAGQLDLLVVALPPGDDPDSLVRREGAQGLQHHLAQARHWLAWELDQLLEDLQADRDDLTALQRCEKQDSELLAQLPEGVMRQKAVQRLLEALGVVQQGKGPSKGTVVPPIEGSANGLPGHQEAVLLAKRRALRLFLCCPSLREVLSVLVVSDPLHREAMGWLWCLSRRLGVDAAGAEGDGLRASVLAALPQMDAPLVHLLRPLVGCGEAVRMRLEAHPEGELMWILDVLEPVGDIKYICQQLKQENV
jgi:DNA primase